MHYLRLLKIVSESLEKTASNSVHKTISFHKKMPISTNSNLIAEKYSKRGLSDTISV